MMLGAEIMALLKSMIVLPLSSSEPGFHLLGLPTGERGLLEELGPKKCHQKNNTGKRYVSRAASGDNSNYLWVLTMTAQMSGKMKAQFCSEIFMRFQVHLSMENEANIFLIPDQRLSLSAKVEENGNFHLAGLLRLTGVFVLSDVNQLLEKTTGVSVAQALFGQHGQKAVFAKIIARL